MEYATPQDGHDIKVGDLILIKGRGEKEYREYPVIRISERYAFAVVGMVERKFPRIFQRLYFSVVPRDQVPIIEYTVGVKPFQRHGACA